MRPRTDSVHLADWPVADPKPSTPTLEEGMALARRLSSLGRAARAEAGIKVRQPLARALVYLPPGSPALPPGVVEDELNVDRVEAIGGARRRAHLRAGPQLQAARATLGQAGPGAPGGHGLRWTVPPRPRALAEGRPVVVELADGPVELGADEVELRVRAQPGFAVSRDGAEVVALDLTLDDDLRRRGLAREVIRHVQEMRKAAGLEVSDWIHLHLVGLDDLGSRSTSSSAARCWPGRWIDASPSRRGAGEAQPSTSRTGTAHPSPPERG